MTSRGSDGLGFTELYRFADHDGFDGVMLGLPGAVSPGVHARTRPSRGPGAEIG
jgi:hypothetical protein